MTVAEPITTVGILALIGFAGGMLSTALVNATSSRNKFIDVITSERIKWVDKLRSDFSVYLSLSLRLASTNSDNEPIEFYKIQMEMSQLIALIDLKLNYEAALDREIANLLRECLHIAMENPEKAEEKIRSTRLGTAQINLRILTRYLLKDEWEKAKYESAGFIRKFALSNASKRRRELVKLRLKKLPAKLPEF